MLSIKMFECYSFIKLKELCLLDNTICLVVVVMSNPSQIYMWSGGVGKSRKRTTLCGPAAWRENSLRAEHDVQEEV